MLKIFVTAAGITLAGVVTFLLWPVLPYFAVVWVTLATVAATAFVAVELRNRAIKGTVELIQASKVHADNRAFLVAQKGLVEFTPSPFGSFGTISGVSNYSPRNHQVNETGTAHQVEPEPPAALPPATVPTFGELLDRGEVGQDVNKLLLGYSLDPKAGPQPLPGSWLKLFSVGVAGLQGSGKTTAVRFIVAQSVLAGARLVPIDPHGNSPDESLASTLAPLSAAFACNPAIEPDEIEAALWVAEQELQKRVSSGKKGLPFILLVDEFTSLLRMDKKLSARLEKICLDIAEQGRKFGVFAMIMGQRWTAEAAGDSTAIRSALASRYVFRMWRDQARLLIPTGEAAKAERLEVGRGFLWTTTGELHQVAIPNTTAADIERVARLIGGLPEERIWPAPSASYQPQISQPSAVIEAKSLNAEDARILSLFASGLDIPAITKEVRGVTTNQGAKYQQAAREVQEALRRAIGGN